MDEEQKAVIEAVVHEAARPFAGVLSDLVGVAGGDALHRFREERNARRPQNQRDILKVGAETLKTKGISTDSSLAPETVVSVLEAGQDRSEPEIKSLFGKLLAAAVDPAKKSKFRPEFADVIKEFQPLDALVLKAFAKPGRNPSSWLNEMSHELQRNPDDIALAAINLQRLDCLQPQQPSTQLYQAAILTPRGRQILFLVTD